MQIEVINKLAEIEKEMRMLQMQIDLLDHKLKTFKHDYNEWKSDLVNVHG